LEITETWRRRRGRIIGEIITERKQGVGGKGKEN
jgi:hypothetical protein